MINIFIEHWHCDRPEAGLQLTIGPVSEQSDLPGLETPPMAILKLTSTQQCSMQITPIDAKGHATTVQAGSVEWTSSNDTVVTVTENSGDETKAMAVSVAPGTATIQVTADADLGTGVVPIVGTLDIEVMPGQAVSVTIAPGTPENQ